LTDKTQSFHHARISLDIEPSFSEAEIIELFAAENVCYRKLRTPGYVMPFDANWDCQALMNILILQHIAIEHPGILLDFFREDGFRWTTVELDEGETIPELDPFDLMVVMGGPQDVWQEDQYPWFREEKTAIRKFVLDMQRPYLGICLGHQLLADATGGRVGLAKRPEVGVLTISSTEAGRRDPLLSALPDPMSRRLSASVLSSTRAMGEKSLPLKTRSDPSPLLLTKIQSTAETYATPWGSFRPATR
jgi:GMP synthase-like glutamine amidotransferase